MKRRKEFYVINLLIAVSITIEGGARFTRWPCPAAVASHDGERAWTVHPRTRTEDQRAYTTPRDTTQTCETRLQMYLREVGKYCRRTVPLST